MPNVSIAPGLGIGYQGLLPNGRPNNAGRLRTFQAGTTTPIATYTNQAGTIANANPIVLNADGRPPQPIWLDNALLYKFQLEDAAGNVLATFDNIEPSASAAGLGGNTGPAFLAQRAVPGYQWLPSGILIQWGATVGIASSANLVFALPVAYSNALLSAVVTPLGTGNSATPVSGAIELVNAGTVRIYNKSATSEAFTWLAIGY
ncbi:MAG: hypothetical protein IT325_09910 [Anaerolineae bacterium]|nr:hypothetical protein [Anaerolineae bacterium]